MLHLALLLGCNDFGLNRVADKASEELDTAGEFVPAADTGNAGEGTPDDDTGIDTASTGGPENLPPEDTAAEEEPTPDTALLADCTGVDFGTWQWWGSQPFDTEAAPTDGSGNDFYDTAYSMSGWSTIAMPERNVPTGYDKAFLAWFELADVPPDMTLTVASDDGLWLWVNGQSVGHWGGDWQEEGCVNEGGSCDVMVDVDPIDVTEFLVPGWNVIAARVSNPVVGSWFDLSAACVP